jgi:hypothetical protein
MGPLLDTALFAAAQKVEHCEIAAYGSLIALVKPLGETDSVKLLARHAGRREGHRCGARAVAISYNCVADLLPTGAGLHVRYLPPVYDTRRWNGVPKPLFRPTLESLAA